MKPINGVTTSAKITDAPAAVILSHNRGKRIILTTDLQKKIGSSFYSQEIYGGHLGETTFLWDLNL